MFLGTDMHNTNYLVECDVLRAFSRTGAGRARDGRVDEARPVRQSGKLSLLARTWGVPLAYAGKQTTVRPCHSTGMSISKILNSPGARTTSSIAMLAESALALYRGNRKIAALLLGAAVLSYRFTVVGIVAELAIRVYQFTR